MKSNKYILELFEEGFDEDTIRAVYLIPLIDTAWADGKVQIEERGIQVGSGAYKLIDSWLTKKPVDDFFSSATNLIEPLFKDLKENRGGDMMWVIKAAERVASATGKADSPISLGERKVIKSIFERLNAMNAKQQEAGRK